MPSFQPRDPDYADRVAAAFLEESIAAHWGSELASVSPGEVEIALSFRDSPTSGQGMLHRSTVASLMDDACLLAALSLTSAGDETSTAEYKLNFLAPSMGSEVVVRAEVVRPGRTITVCRADALTEGRLVARMLATLAVSRP